LIYLHLQGKDCSSKSFQFEDPHVQEKIVKILANSFKRKLRMFNNSLAFNIRTCQHLFKVENISVYPFCTKLSQSSSFFLNTSVVFLSAKLFVQNRCRVLSSLFKWQNTSPRLQLRELTYPHFIQNKFCYWRVPFP